MRTISSKVAMLVVPGLLLCVDLPAWAGTVEHNAPAGAETVAGKAEANSLFSILNSVNETDPKPSGLKEHCKAPLYSQHDVVGDPEACFLGRYSLGASGNQATSGVPGVP